MNYENLYQALQPQEKTLKDNITSLQKSAKTAARKSESGDIRGLLRDLQSMTDTVSSISAALSEMKQAVDSFDTKTYLESGDFAGQMLEACREKEIDVQGTFPTYEMFPCCVKLDAENQDIYLDRKKIACMRPLSLAGTIKTRQEKLNKASFNPQAFLGELSDAYDIALLKLKKRPGTDIYLKTLYKFMAPMSRFRRDYDQQSFAFDLARLYNSGIDETKSGRRFQFGPNRENSSKAFRILDKYGNEQFLSMACFYGE